MSFPSTLTCDAVWFGTRNAWLSVVNSKLLRPVSFTMLAELLLQLTVRHGNSRGVNITLVGLFMSQPQNTVGVQYQLPAIDWLRSPKRTIST